MKNTKQTILSKRNFIRATLVVVLFCCITGYTSAQNSLNVYMEIIGGSTSFSDSVVSSSQPLHGTMVIEVTDTTNISKIHVKMGTSDGANDLFSQLFIFDVTDSLSLPTGTTYLREGKVIYLGIGNYTGLNHFFGEAKLEDNAGLIGPAIKYEQ